MYFVLPSFPPVLRIREIFLQIRIRMRVLGSVPHKSEYSRYQGGFSYYFCLMIEGSGAGSVLVTNGSGRPENIRIRIGMRIRNNASHPPPLYEITIVGHNPHKWRNFKKGVMRHLQTIYRLFSLIHKHKVLIKSVNVMYIKAFEYRRVQRIALDGMEHVLGITEGTKASMYRNRYRWLCSVYSLCTIITSRIQLNNRIWIIDMY